MSENAPTRSLDDIDLAALRVSIVITSVLHFIHVTLWQTCLLDVMSYELKCQFASDTSTTM